MMRFFKSCFVIVYIMAYLKLVLVVLGPLVYQFTATASLNLFFDASGIQHYRGVTRSWFCPGLGYTGL